MRCGHGPTTWAATGSSTSGQAAASCLSICARHGRGRPWPDWTSYGVLPGCLPTWGGRSPREGAGCLLGSCLTARWSSRTSGSTSCRASSPRRTRPGCCARSSWIRRAGRRRSGRPCPTATWSGAPPTGPPRRPVVLWTPRNFGRTQHQPIRNTATSQASASRSAGPETPPGRTCSTWWTAAPRSRSTTATWPTTGRARGRSRATARAAWSTPYPTAPATSPPTSPSTRCTTTGC